MTKVGIRDGDRIENWGFIIISELFINLNIFPECKNLTENNQLLNYLNYSFILVKY